MAFTPCHVFATFNLLFNLYALYNTFIQYATEIPKDKFLSKLNKEINHKPGPNEKNKAKQPNKNIIIPIPRNQKRKTNKIVITARDKKQVLNSSKKVLKTIKQYTLNNH